ncbi:MAG: acetate--CoA ligase [Crocinitomicaceae bacterium]|nr:acetate--CoA ligase [Crocinitomicaceae bacterium]
MISKINSLLEYQDEYRKSIENPEKFWSDLASTFSWKKKWDKVVDWDFVDLEVNWFGGGQLNITENCLDRHLEINPDKIAIIWEPNDPAESALTYTYKELHEEVCRFANVLTTKGCGKGDTVCLYMPMVPELAIAVLGCARIGAIHSVVFAGFSAKALADRINDAACRFLVTADGSFRGSKVIGLKEIADEALTTCPSIQTSVIYQRTGQPVHMLKGRDVWWHDEMEMANDYCAAATMESEDPLFILYTSGSTGQPKGVVHSTAGYMTYAEYSFRNVFQYEESDIYWCTADIGWITGHTYIVYGPLLAGATTVMFEGVPTWPDAGRFWEICEKHKVNIFYTAPTAIRALQVHNDSFVTRHDLTDLKVLGTVGEPINEEAWKWYHQVVGKSKCPIVDTWWQTETGGIMISPLAGITPLKPSYATLPLPGIQPCLMDADGNELEGNEVSGNLCIKYPWPSMIRTTWGDHVRCKSVYFSSYKGYYFTGDGCKRDANGMYRITGRVDDVINVSGHRIGTAEVEDALDEHANVVEAAVVGYPHEIKGQGIYAYIICSPPPADEETFRKELINVIVKQIGPIAKPDKIQVVPGLPKTRSGKIMRRILRKIAEGDTSSLGDTSTLLDPLVVEEIIEGAL